MLIRIGWIVKLGDSIYCGDNIVWMKKMPDEFVDLCYIDPPFFSNRQYEIIFNDGEEIRSFKDRWKGGINHYVEWMSDRVFEIHRLLKKTGTFYLHCDWHASHYLKVMCDDIFGQKNFQNEVVWYYRGAGVSRKRWARRHDVLLFYSRSSKWFFNPDPARQPYAKATKERFGHYIGNVRGGRDFGQQELNPLGKHPDDVWTIQPIAPSAKERRTYSYPTLKPRPLLERIISTSSKEGDLVFDPFCGCGTTLYVAELLKRKWLGIDVSPTACRLMKRRLSSIVDRDIEIIGVKYDIEELKQFEPFEFQNWVIGSLGGTASAKKTRDMGIDGYTFLERDPIQVKQSEHVGRIAVDNFETALTRINRNKGIIVGFSFTKDAHEEVARAKRENGLEITLMTIEEVRMHLSSGDG